MSTPAKSIKYQGIFLLGPSVAYGCYVLLLALSLLRQRTGEGSINFMFLTFWGIITFLIALVMSSLGLVHNKKLRQVLLIVNIAVSLALIILSLSVIVLVHKSNITEYACRDFVRCLMK
jgi:hypothetical protein